MKSHQHGVVTLWDMLTILSLGTAPGGGYLAAKSAKIGNPFLWIAIGVEGLAIGVLSIWLVTSGGDHLAKYSLALVERLGFRSERATNAVLIPIYAGIYAWSFFSMFLA